MRAVARAIGVMRPRLVEVLLTALLAIAVGVFGFGIRAQVLLQEKVTDNALTAVRNQERISAAENASAESDKRLAESLAQVQQLWNKSEEAILERIRALAERLDQRFDTLEFILNLIKDGNKDTQSGG